MSFLRPFLVCATKVSLIGSQAFCLQPLPTLTVSIAWSGKLRPRKSTAFSQGPPQIRKVSGDAPALELLPQAWGAPLTPEVLLEAGVEPEDP